jgi:small subunit ribosomal protein S15
LRVLVYYFIWLIRSISFCCFYENRFQDHLVAKNISLDNEEDKDAVLGYEFPLKGSKTGPPAEEKKYEIKATAKGEDKEDKKQLTDLYLDDAADEDEEGEEEETNETKSGRKARLFSRAPQEKKKKPANQTTVESFWSKRLGNRQSDVYDDDGTIPNEKLEQVFPELYVNAPIVDDPPAELIQRLLEREKQIEESRLPKHEKLLWKARQKAMKTWQRHIHDVGSEEVQIAILTEKIAHLTAHLLKNHKDNSCRRGVEMMAQRRRRHLVYLYRKNPGKASELSKHFGIHFSPKGFTSKEQKYEAFTNTKRIIGISENAKEVLKIKKNLRNFNMKLPSTEEEQRKVQRQIQELKLQSEANSKGPATTSSSVK